MKKNKSIRSQHVFQLLLLTGIIIFANVISSFVFARIDLTGDKRFTISEASKKTLGSLRDVVYIKVYLEGDFPAGFQQLRNATREMIDELRNYSKGNLEYEFIDPSANPDEKERNNLYRQLAEKGLQPTNLESKTKEGTTQKIIFPGALVSFSNEEVPVQLLKDQLGVSSAQMLNNSIQNLEYELVNAIKKVTNPIKPNIAFLEGHGELGQRDVEDVSNVLKLSYNVKRVPLNHQLGILNDYKTIIIAKPDTAFDEKDKFILDQYIMNGGNVVWLIDQMQVTMDSLSTRGETMALGRPLNLDDMLFRFGVRINYDLVLDLQSSPIPVVTGFIGNQPRTQLRPWFYFPVMAPADKHPVVNNLNSIKGMFVSTIDTIATSGISKSVLLTTSKYTRIAPAPVRVSLGIMQRKPEPSQYRQQHLITAVLLEGEFQSNYKNRLEPVILNDTSIAFKDHSVKRSKMVVISDGDVTRNEFQKGRALACGYDKYTGTFFGNRSFMQNIVDYLTDDGGLMTVRNKEFKIRMLDPQMVEDKEQMLKVINCALPVMLIISFGIIKSNRRKRKYAK